MVVHRAFSLYTSIRIIFCFLSLINIIIIIIILVSLFSHLIYSCVLDLAAVYRKDILILRDADLIHPNSSPSWESLSLTLPRPLSYPVGLTQDSLNNRLFVAEASSLAEGKILSLTLSDQLEVMKMTPVIKSEFL